MHLETNSNISYAQFCQRYVWDPNTPHLLSAGGLGAVYLADDTVLNRQVMLKWYAVEDKYSKKLSLEQKAYLLNERYSTHHKNIVKYEVCYRFQMESECYDVAVLPYYPEGDLYQLVQRQGLTLQQKEEIAYQLLDGIAFYEAEDFLVDLRPSHILIIKTLTGEFIPKIGDFDSYKTGEELLRYTVLAWEFRFVAPEQWLGARLKFNSVLWAYGMLLYYLFLGTFPIAISQPSLSDEYKAYLTILKHWELESAEIQAIPAPFQAWVKQCLVVDPKKRVKSLQDFTLN